MKKYVSLLIVLLISSQLYAQDLPILKAALTSLHPGIERYETPAQVDSLFTALELGTRKPLSQAQYYILLSQAITHIRCGHTYLNYWNQDKAIKEALYSKTVPPVLFRLIGRKMIITHNLSRSPLVKPGDEVLSINGSPIKGIVDSLLTVSPSDGQHGLPRKLDNISIEPLDADTANYNLFDIYFPLFFPKNLNTTTYVLKMKRPAGNIYTVTVASLTKDGRLQAYNTKFGKLPVHESNWSLRFLNPATAVFKIGDFETWEWKADYRKYLDSIFTLLKQRDVKNLIVDIRGNGGGDDEARDEVFSYLTAQPFGCEEPMHRRFRFLSVPDTLLTYLKTWNKSFKDPKDPADYVKVAAGDWESKKEMAQACDPILPKAGRFKGRMFLLTDGRNASTTFTMAKLFRTYHAGEIVGEPTGGNQQGINGGQFFFLYLPVSKIEIDIPLVWGAYPGNRPDTGIVPDKLVPVTVSSISRNADPALSYVLKEIAAAK